MRSWIVTLIIFSIITIGGILYVLDKNATQVITYFPLDENSSFVEASTSLSITPSKNNDSYFLDWTSLSESEFDLYLRQDASLLFANGKLQGIRSKWEQHTNRIELREQINYSQNAYWESISFHHGEIHGDDDTIKSLQQMSFDDLYVYKDHRFQSFKGAKKNQEEHIQEDLIKKKNQQLLKHWQLLTSHFSINIDDYHVIPLTDLIKYQDDRLPGFTLQQTNKIIGQLWEGLYKNYLIPAAQTTTKKFDNLMPVILLDKNQDHLYVLFELNGNKEQLIQKIK